MWFSVDIFSNEIVVPSSSETSPLRLSEVVIKNDPNTGLAQIAKWSVDAVSDDESKMFRT